MFKWLSNLFNPKPKEDPVPYKLEPVKVEESQVKPADIAFPELHKEPVMAVAEAPVVEAKPKRARTKGKFKADDKATSTVNEAWVDGKSPAKKVKKPKVEKAAPAAVPVMKVSKPRTKKAN